MDVQSLINDGKPVRVPQSRKEKIEAELKLLEWHKMANAAAIKGALLQTKTTKEDASHMVPQHAQDDERWIKRVIKEEHTRPLHVAKDFVLQYEEKERINADRLTHQVDRHISTLKTLRSKLETRHELKTRTEEYRQWQKGFLPKKHAVMVGKTLEEFEATMPKTANLSNPDDEIDDEAMRKGLTHGKNATSQELSTVLDSLSRLAELEQRISGLEKENKYDKMKALENPGGANQRTSIEFQKKRGIPDASGTGPVGISYQIRNKPTQSGGPWSVQVPVGGGSNAVRANRQSGGSNQYGDDSMYDDGAEGGTFITAQGGGGFDQSSAAANREAQKRERARQLELASAGQKQLRGRLQDKRVRAKEQLLGAKKHEAAMKEMARRKTENSKKPTKGINNAAKNATTRVVALPRRGIGAGIKNPNKHLQEFEKMKTSYRKKKEANERKTYAKQATTTAVNNRFTSQTAPAYSNTNHPQYRKPTTRVGGTITRRTDQPTRRAQPGGGSIASSGVRSRGGSDPLSRLPSTAPAIAVTGLGGLRVIKANNTTTNNSNSRNNNAYSSNTSKNNRIVNARGGKLPRNYR